MMAGIDDIAAERKRHFDVEKFTVARDRRGYPGGQLINAAVSYATYARSDCDFDAARAMKLHSVVPTMWPWSVGWWKPTNRRQMLIKAGALIAAEIDRFDLETKENQDND